MITISHTKEVSGAQFAEISQLEGELHTGAKDYPREYLDRLLEDKNAFLVLVKDDEKVIGMGTLYVIQKLDNRASFIEDVIVSSEYRGQGLGEKLMRELIEVARRDGVRTINLTSRGSREAANALYQKLGFELRETNAYKLKLQ